MHPLHHKHLVKSIQDPLEMLKDPLMARDVILPEQTLQLQFSNLVLIKYSAFSNSKCDKSGPRSALIKDLYRCAKL